MKRFLVSFCLVVCAVAPSTANAITVVAARALPLDSAATVDDLVLTEILDQTSSGSLKSIYAQDATGGVAIFGSNASIDAILNGPDTMPGTGDDLVRGSRIDLTGSTATFNGLFELDDAPTAFTTVFDGTPGAPIPIDSVVADFQDGSAIAEAREGMLIRLQNVTFTAAGNFAGATNYIVSTSGVNATVRVATAALPIVGTPIPVGPVDVIGVVSQFDSTDPRDGGYQILISRASDIVPVPEPASFALAGLAVAGVLLLRRK